MLVLLARVKLPDFLSQNVRLPAYVLCVVDTAREVCYD